jgi:hypothetical protein
MATLPLSRSGRPVQSFLSALGRVRETRLTATLAYLIISRFPDEFLPLVCRTPKGDFEVSVEETDEGDRYDVLVKGGKFPIVLEGKTGLRQSHRQLLRYVQTVRPKYKRRPGLVIVDVGSHKSQGFPHVAAHVYFAVGFGWRGYSHCARVGGTQNDHHDDAIFTPCPATQAASRGHIGR